MKSLKRFTAQLPFTYPIQQGINSEVCLGSQAEPRRAAPYQPSIMFGKNQSALDAKQK